MFETKRVLWLLLGLGLTAPANAAPRPLTVDEAVAQALRNSPDLRGSEARAQAQVDTARATGARILPSGNLSEEYLHYKQAFSVAFPLGPPGAPVPSIVARDQTTNQFVASATQPLTGLLHIVPDYTAANATADAARAEAKVTAAAVRENVRILYLRYFEAVATADIARASEAQLGEQISVSEAKVKAGAATTVDVLRLRVAAANARQQEIAAKAHARVARAAIMTALGERTDNSEIELVEPLALEQHAGSAPAPSLEHARELALRLRPELLAARYTETAATRARFARWASLLPEVDLVAAYVRIDGQLFAPKDSLFIGLRANWAVWTWGASFFAGRAASSQADAAAAQAQARSDLVEVDVASKLAEFEAADSALDAAKAAIASAEEAFRVTQALVSAGSATTTDLLDAQSALTTARLNLTRASYDRAIALVSLDRATGAE